MFSLAERQDISLKNNLPCYAIEATGRTQNSITLAALL